MIKFWSDPDHYLDLLDPRNIIFKNRSSQNVMDGF